jgi:hypothetical protein
MKEPYERLIATLYSKSPKERCLAKEELLDTIIIIGCLLALLVGFVSSVVGAITIFKWLFL